MARAIGVDIGERYLKVVELVGSPRSFRVQRVAVREILLPAALTTRATRATGARI